MAKPPRNKPVVNFLAVLTQLDSPNARTSAIVAGAFVENNLALAIMARLRPLDEEEQKQLFDNRGATLGTFANKIDMGFALNLYDDRVRNDLTIIKDVRNQFAHHLYITEFTHPEIVKLCNRLSVPSLLAQRSGKPERTDPKERFLQTASYFAAGLSLDAKAVHRPSPPDALAE